MFASVLVGLSYRGIVEPKITQYSLVEYHCTEAGLTAYLLPFTFLHCPTNRSEVPDFPFKGRYDVVTLIIEGSILGIDTDFLKCSSYAC